tara:strand:+ start:32396 stop:33880 length:1485 start_codon:yes stop_codon:yes gene_type:complete
MKKQFKELFMGLERAHGSYDISGERADGKKQGIAKTVREDVTETKWEMHLAGQKGLGIIPINDDSCCRFGAIDVDQYDGLDLKKINEKLKTLNLPLWPCQSKSGGVHMYLFTKEWVPADILQAKLRDMAAALGFGGSEIFPKQTQILADRGDVGQWINMPYFNTERWCNKLKPNEFVEKALAARLSLSELQDLKIKQPTSDFDDGPPCLQHLSTQGFPSGTRNNGLFNIAVYCRKRDPDNWKPDMESFNIKLMDPPLSSSEVQAVVKSASRKEYQFTCSKAPIAPYCNAAVCKLRKFGIDGSNDLPAIHSLTKFNTAPPIWFLDVDGGGRLELETDDLQNQRRFQRKCMEKLNTMPNKMSDQAWTKLINHLLENLTIVEAPADASPIGQLMEHIDRFCNGRVQAKNRDELILGKPWTENGRHYFRITDLMAYLDRIHFRDYRVHQVTSILKNQDAEHHFFNCKGKGVNCWSIPTFDQNTEELETPKVEGKDDLF